MSSLPKVELWRHAETLFEAALDRPLEERAAFLERACGGDQLLRQTVDALLRRDLEEPSFLETPLIKHQNLAMASVEESAWVGRQLGPYRLLRSIGVGGMSQVFLGQRIDDQVEEKVAVKVIGEKASQAFLLRSLRRERQILSKLDHPNIARSLDGGTTEEGMPYVVLEYIDGLPVTDYCDTARLEIRPRLELFRKICDAVDYAHRHLVVHRDLKPSNILVTDGGEPKLLDFGIAKLLDVSWDATASEQTQTQERFFTPQYASPEQIVGEHASTASDTFSLGVLLYQMLTGLRPRDLGSRSGDAVSKSSGVAAFLPPSTAVVATDPQGDLRALESPLQRAEIRNTTPLPLQRQLSGDLDCIVSHCLSHSPEERYRSVGELSEDIQRYLAGMPVTAQPPRWSYRMGKFILRHRVAVSLGTVAMVALFSLGLGLILQSQQVVRERDRAEAARAEAEEVTHFLTEAFLLSDPYQSSQSGFRPGDQVTVQEVLDYSAKRIRGELTNQPRLQARLMHTIGTVVGELGRSEEAAALLRDALAIRRRARNRPLEIADSLNNLGVNVSRMDHLDEAALLIAEALELSRQAGKGGESQLAESLLNTAKILQMQGKDLEGAEKLMREALSLRESVIEPDHRKVVQSQLSLARLLRRKGELGEAEAFLREALDICVRAEGEDHAQVATILGELAWLLTLRGEYDTAEAYFLRVLDILEGKLGEAHPSFLEARSELGLFYREKGDYAAAEQSLRDTLELRRRVDPENLDGQTALLSRLGLIFLDQDQPAVAEPYFREALAIASASQGFSRREEPFYLRNLGLAMNAQGNAQAAEPLMRRSSQLLEKEQGAEGYRFANSLASLASVLISLEEFEEALSLSLQAEEILNEIFSSGHPRLAMAHGARGGALVGLGRFEEAEPLLLASFNALQENAAHYPRVIRLARQRLFQLYQAWGRPAEAERYQ